MKQTCLLVLGMHRSGTSALSGVLNALGVYQGTQFIAARAENPKGFFENSLICEANDDLLTQAGSNVHDDFYNEDKISGNLNTEKLTTVLINEFKYSQLFSIKDPRIGYLLPIYKHTLTSLNIDAKAIIPVRSPFEVARSLQVRNGFSLEKGLLHWAYHFLVVEKNTRDLPRVYTTFEGLMQSPHDTLQLIDYKLDLNLLGKYDSSKHHINSFLTPELKHHTISLDNTSAKTPQIIQDIISLLPNLNEGATHQAFDDLYRQLFDYQTLFYNTNITSTADEVERLKDKINDASQNLLTAKQSLKQAEQLAEVKASEIAQLDQQLQQNQDMLKSAKRALELKDQALSQAAQSQQNAQKDLQQYRAQLQAVQDNLTQANQQLQQERTMLEAAKRSLELKDQALVQANQLLQQEQAMLEAAKRGLELKDQSLTQANQLTQTLEHELKQKQEILETAKHGLVLKDQALAQHKHQLLSQQSQELENLRSELFQIYQSSSWKITRPLRALKRKLNK